MFAYPNGRPGRDFAPVHVDLVRRQVFRGSQEAHLTPTEYKLLAFLAGFLWLAVPLIIDHGSNIVTRLPSYYATFREILRQSGNRLIQGIATQMPTTMSMNVPSGVYRSEYA